MSANPKILIVIGAVLVVLGFFIPFLTVLGYIRSTFFVNFLSYGASIVGLFLGMLGAAMYVRVRRG